MKTKYSPPECRLREWRPERSILSDYFPFEDENYSEGGEYVW